MDKPRKAIIFARVSTKRQEREGLSLKEIQVPRAKEYAKNNNLKVVDVIAISETGGQYKERKKFSEFVERMKNDESITDIISFRVDRLTRNFHDAVAIDDLRIKYNKRIHLIDNNLILTRDSRKNDLLQWDMNVMLARQYLEGVREDGENSKYQKLKCGELPWNPPFGYELVKVERGHPSVALIKEPNATIVREIHNRYSTGTYSCKSLAGEINDEFLTKFPQSRIHDILTDKFYIGFMIDKKTGKEYPHIYDHLIDDKTFYLNQEILHGHSTRRRHYDGIPAIYRGLIDCAVCGCSITPDFKKKKQKNGNVHEYAYYHCTNGKKEHTDGVKTIREEQITEAIAQSLEAFAIPKDKLEELRAELRSTHEAKNSFYEAERKKIIKQKSLLSNRQQHTFDAWMDRSITKEVYEQNSARYAEELREIAEREKRLDEADTNFYTTVGYLLAIFENAPELFKRAKLEEKRQIFGLLFSNLQFDGEKLILPLKKPFDELVDSSKGSLWLGMRDSNPRMAGPEPAALPLGESPVDRLIVPCSATPSQYAELD